MFFIAVYSSGLLAVIRHLNGGVSVAAEVAMNIAALYTSVTRSIIEQLEKGAIPWVKPWTGTPLMPTNAATGRHYSGINVCILWHEAEERGYHTHQWMTYVQAHQKGGQVRKGELSTHVVFVKQLNIMEDNEEKTIGMMKAYSVFNVEQIDGLDIEQTPQPQSPVDQFIAATKADIRYGGDTAAYIPSRDCIILPAIQDFKGTEHYYATALHELTHWTGAKHRLDRDLTGRFKTKSYAAEELVAELGAAFLCAHLGVQGELRHSGYIGHWLELFKEDNKAIFTASSRAAQAADYLRAL